MDPTRDSFLAALAADPNDDVTRLIYADWLEEQGEYEEAQRMRKWREAMDWLETFCNENNPDPDDADAYYDETTISPNYLLTEAIKCITDGGDGTIYFGSNERAMYALLASEKEFWEKVYIITGLQVPEDRPSKISFRCGC